MAWGFIADLYGKERVIRIATLMEYYWSEKAYHDPFARV